jgi:hypothetical protein
MLPPHPEAGVDVDRYPDRHRLRGAHRVHDVEMGRVVDHDRDPCRRAGRLDEPSQRSPVHGRVRDHEVVAHVVLLEPECLGEGV